MLLNISNIMVTGHAYIVLYAHTYEYAQVLSRCHDCPSYTCHASHLLLYMLVPCNYTAWTFLTVPGSVTSINVQGSD